MKRSHCFHRRALIRYWFAFAVTGLIVSAAPIVGSAARAQATSPVAQADDEKPKAAEKIQVQERVFSGPQPGEKIKPFKVLSVKDGEANELEIVKKTPDESTTLICFVHKFSNDDRILFGLGLVDFYAARHKELTSHYVLLFDDTPKISKMIQAWARGSLFKNSLVSVSVDGADGPGAYGLNRNVAMTVVVAKGDQVVNNLVFNAPNYQDLQKIMAAVAKVNDKPEPKLAEVQNELRVERQKQQTKRIKASPVFKLAPNEELGRIMFGMVNARGNRIKNAERRSKLLLEWAGDSEERKAELKKYCKSVLAGEFKLDSYSRTAIEALAD